MIGLYPGAELLISREQRAYAAGVNDRIFKYDRNRSSPPAFH